MSGNKQLLSFISLVLLLSIFMAGCQSPSASPGAGNGEEEAKAEDGDSSNTLSLLIPNYYNSVEEEQWSLVIEKFKELHPDIEVQLETGDVRVESGSLTSLLQSGVNTPDVILMNSGPSRISVLSEAELIQPLNDLYEENSWKEALRESAYQLIAGEENMYEVPHMMDAIAYFYNKDVFEENGVNVPASEKEFMKALQKLKENDVAPITIGARNGYAIGWLFGIMLESVAGTEKMEEVLYGDGKWNDPEVLKTAEMLKEWVDSGYISKNAVTLTEADSKFDFLNKQSAMYPGGTYLITELAEQDLQDSVGFFMMPSFIDNQTAEPTGGIGQSWVIPTKADNRDTATVWLNFILSQDYVETAYSSPDYNFILASSISTEVEPAGDVLNDASQELEQGSSYNPSVFIGVETKEAYFQNLQGLVGGLVTPGEAMNNIEAEAEKERSEGN
ncbi:extracellular solute-binding protein [Jeotgalibacillus sp. S-D1]|uniref:ABC transporter substrate-binding protein n=1 Tax=Jeotgalibacillus sp. S-D1 TaxID=2552189 RepID=UPI00105A4080|nr:extracellular solute-binding protein [Jeotgalibacillus sp. S-D1]TDL32770.1 extracellular solute-binding protein [Jeotgalibacillus sp. S-D1]